MRQKQDKTERKYAEDIVVEEYHLFLNNETRGVTVVTDIGNKSLDSTSSGLAGEGKVFVSDVYEAVYIGTGSRGESAL